MKGKCYLLIFMSAILWTACTNIQDPTVVKVDDVKLKNLSKDAVDVDANMVLHNPNSFALDLASADIKAYVDDVEIATISQTFDTEMPAKSDFDMPLNIKMDLKRLYDSNPIAALGKGLQIMSDRQLDVRFKGSIRAGHGRMKVEIPVDQVELVKF